MKINVKQQNLTKRINYGLKAIENQKTTLDFTSNAFILVLKIFEPLWPSNLIWVTMVIHKQTWNAMHGMSLISFGKICQKVYIYSCTEKKHTTGKEFKT